MILIQDKLCFVAHLSPNATNSFKESYAIDLGLTNVAINIQPAAPEDTLLDNGAFTRTWTGYTTESGIRVGDLVTVSGTNYPGVSGAGPGLLNRQLIVRGVENWDMLDLPHYELMMTEFVENQPN